MAGLDGLQSAGTGPRLGVPGLQDAGAPLHYPQASLPRPEPPRALGTTSRSLMLVRILGSA